MNAVAEAALTGSLAIQHLIHGYPMLPRPPADITSRAVQPSHASEVENHVALSSQRNAFQIIFQKIADAWQSIRSFFAGIFFRMEGHQNAARAAIPNHLPSKAVADINLLPGAQITAGFSPAIESLPGNGSFETSKAFLCQIIAITNSLPAGQSDFDVSTKEHANKVCQRYGDDSAIDKLSMEQKKDLIIARIVLRQIDQVRQDMVLECFGQEFLDSLLEHLPQREISPAPIERIEKEVKKEDSLAIDSASPAVVENKGLGISQTEETQRHQDLFNEFLAAAPNLGERHSNWMKFYQTGCIELAKNYKASLEKNHLFHDENYRNVSDLLKRHEDFMRVTMDAISASQPDVSIASHKNSEAPDRQQQAELRDEFFKNFNNSVTIFDGLLLELTEKFYKKQQDFLGKAGEDARRMIAANFRRDMALDLKGLALGLKILADIENSKSQSETILSIHEISTSTVSERLAGLQAVKDLLAVLQDVKNNQLEEYDRYIGQYASNLVTGVSLQDRKFPVLLSKLLDHAHLLAERLDALMIELASSELNSNPPSLPQTGLDAHGLDPAASLIATVSASEAAPSTSLLSTDRQGNQAQLPEWPRRLFNAENDSASASELREALGLTGFDLNDFIKLTLVPAAKYFHQRIYETGANSDPNPDPNPDHFTAAITLAARWPQVNKEILRQAKWTDADISALDFLLDVSRIGNGFEGYAKREFVISSGVTSRFKARSTQSPR